MLEFLKSWVMTIISLVMFIVLLEIVLPSGKTKKMVNMVSGFILIITMANPVLGLFGKTIDFKDINFETGDFLDRQTIETNSKILSEKQNMQILEVYRQNIIGRLRELCEGERDIVFVKAEVQLTEDAASKSFGDIRMVYMDIAEGKTRESDITPVNPVEKVKIGESAEVVKKPVVNNRLTGRMEDLVQNALGLSKDKVVINVVENK